MGVVNITCQDAPFELDVKRFYLPGIVVFLECPNCQHSWQRDLARDYLNYPTVNGPEQHNFYCDECEHEWKEDLILRVTLERVPKHVEGGLEPSGLEEPADMQCVKCHAVSGDDWSQCQGSCPIPLSPHYDPSLRVESWKAVERLLTTMTTSPSRRPHEHVPIADHC